VVVVVAVVAVELAVGDAAVVLSDADLSLSLHLAHELLPEDVAAVAVVEGAVAGEEAVAGEGVAEEEEAAEEVVAAAVDA